MNGHQEWLEAPYTNAAKEQEEFELWCAENDVDPESDTADDEYQLFLDTQEDDIDDEAWQEDEEL